MIQIQASAKARKDHKRFGIHTQVKQFSTPTKSTNIDIIIISRSLTKWTWSFAKLSPQNWNTIVHES